MYQFTSKFSLFFQHGIVFKNPNSNLDYERVESATDAQLIPQFIIGFSLPSPSAQNNLWELCVFFAPQRLHLVQLNAVEGDVWFPDKWPVLFRAPIEVFSAENHCKVSFYKCNDNNKKIKVFATHIVQSLVMQDTIIVLQHFEFVL